MRTEQRPPPPRFSWAWDSLTVEDSQRIAKALEGDQKDAVQSVCNSEYCSLLASSLNKMFASLNWSIVDDFSVTREYAPGATGILLDRDTSQAVQSRKLLKTTRTLRLASDCQIQFRIDCRKRTSSNHYSRKIPSRSNARLSKSGNL